MHILISLTIMFALSAPSLAFSTNRMSDKYVEVHEIDTNTLTPMVQLPPQDPAIHSLPTDPTVPLIPICTREGYFRDPFNCRKFYYCQDAAAIPAGYYCQTGLIFNTIANVCDVLEFVQC